MHPLSANLRLRAATVTTLLVLLSFASLVAACMIGSVSIPLADMPGALREFISGQPVSLPGHLLGLRAERAATAFVTGASLSLAGVMMQALLRNPLADPYVLGISTGASVGALAALLFMCAAWMVDAASFAGAVIVSMMLYALARRDLRGGTAAEGGTAQLLLTGQVLSAGCVALITLMLSIAPEGRLRNMVFWLIGDLSGSSLRWLPWIVLAGVLAFSLCAARSLNVMALHAEAAATLGIRVGALRKGLFFCSGLLTASAVTTAGSIGFVGLIVPHACRFAFGPDHRLLVPCATLVGGSYLVLADTLARTVIAPQQLPAGVVTALVGTPVFLYQLHRLRK